MQYNQRNFRKNKKFIYLFIAILFLNAIFITFKPKQLNLKFFHLFVNRKKKHLSKCLKKPSEVLQINKIFPLNKSLYHSYNRCILGHEPDPDKTPFILVVDSLCPLGIAVVEELEKRKIKHLDIRGKRHLNLNTTSGQEIISEFMISKALIVCDTDQSHSFKPVDEPVISAVSDIEGDVNLEVPNVFGHFRSMKTNNKLLSLFTRCQNDQHIQIIDSDDSYALAQDAASAIVDRLNSTQNETLSLKCYTERELSIRFYNYCNNHKPDPLVKELLNKSHPYMPRGPRNLTLSIVGTTTFSPRFLQRVEKTLTMYNYYLSSYPQLPLEILLVLVYENETKATLNPLFKGKTFLNKYTRYIVIDHKKYQKIYEKYNCTAFPEFIFKNVGIRRAFGEYIMAVNMDTVVPKSLFDSVLHYQFTPHTYMKAIRMDKNPNTKLNKLAKADPPKDNCEQLFLGTIQKVKWPKQMHMDGGGDSQLAHWTAWKNVKGFINSKDVYHVDTLLVMEFILQQPNPLFMKFLVGNIHWNHPKTSTKAPHAKWWNDTFTRKLLSGYTPADLGEKSDDWGLSDDPDLPPIEF